MWEARKRALLDDRFSRWIHVRGRGQSASPAKGFQEKTAIEIVFGWHHLLHHSEWLRERPHYIGNAQLLFNAILFDLWLWPCWPCYDLLRYMAISHRRSNIISEINTLIDRRCRFSVPTAASTAVLHPNNCYHTDILEHPRLWVSVQHQSVWAW